MPDLSLKDLQDRIAQQNAEVQRLRQELETRQSQLASLKQRKQALRTELHQIDQELAAIAAGTQPSAAAPANVLEKNSSSKPSRGEKSAGQSLPVLIVSLIRDAGQPLTVKQLAIQIKQRGFRSKSKRFSRMVEKRAYDLRKRGILERAPNQAGFILAKPKSGTSQMAGPTRAATPKSSMKTAPSSPSKEGMKTAAKGKPGMIKQLPLREVLTRILKQQNRPMTGGQLAEAALKAGYQTTSKRLADSVWVALGHMKNVENIPGQGYRLKRAKA